LVLGRRLTPGFLDEINCVAARIQGPLLPTRMHSRGIFGLMGLSFATIVCLTDMLSQDIVSKSHMSISHQWRKIFPFSYSLALCQPHQPRLGNYANLYCGGSSAKCTELDSTHPRSARLQVLSNPSPLFGCFPRNLSFKFRSFDIFPLHPC
jgi:hypothetical protein